MARLPFVDASTPGVDAQLVNDVQGRRGGSLLNLDRLLLHSAPIARGWNGYFAAIRGSGVLNGALRELLILQVAVLNRAPYEFAQHEAVALSEGVTPAQIEALGDWRASPLFTPTQRGALAYAEAMTVRVQVPQPLFDALRTHLCDREVVELTATVAAYNMVSRFLEALQVEVEAG